MLLTSSGFLYTFGSNEFGQLGNPSEDNLDEPKTSIKEKIIPESLIIPEPMLIFSLLNLKVTEIAAGGNHNIVFAK